MNYVPKDAWQVVYENETIADSICSLVSSENYTKNLKKQFGSPTIVLSVEEMGSRNFQIRLENPKIIEFAPDYDSLIMEFAGYSPSYVARKKIEKLGLPSQSTSTAKVGDNINDFFIAMESLEDKLHRYNATIFESYRLEILLNKIESFLVILMERYKKGIDDVSITIFKLKELQLVLQTSPTSKESSQLVHIEKLRADIKTSIQKLVSEGKFGSVYNTLDRFTRK
jgi:hypothetical protein